MKTDKAKHPVSARLDRETHEWFTDYCVESGKSHTDVVIEAITVYRLLKANNMQVAKV